MKAMYTAATAMLAMENNVAVIANNIANIRTTGYKKMRAEFQDLLYQNIRSQGNVKSKDGSRQPSGIQIGMGVKTGATYRIMSQGSLVNTEKNLDLAIRGEGFFIIKLSNGEQAYTRDGTFEVNANGKIVNIDGKELQPSITIPQDARDVTISQKGVVQIKTSGSNQIKIIGQIQIARFVNPSGLQSQGNNLYLQSESSGEAQIAYPDNNGYGALLQGYIEQSNVNAINEIAELIQAQRAYEMNSKIISASDEMLKSTNNIR